MFDETTHDFFRCHDSVDRWIKENETNESCKIEKAKKAMWVRDVKKSMNFIEFSTSTNRLSNDFVRTISTIAHFDEDSKSRHAMIVLSKNERWCLTSKIRVCRISKSFSNSLSFRCDRDSCVSNLEIILKFAFFSMRSRFVHVESRNHSQIRSHFDAIAKWTLFTFSTNHSKQISSRKHRSNRFSSFFVAFDSHNHVIESDKFYSNHQVTSHRFVTSNVRDSNQLSFARERFLKNFKHYMRLTRDRTSLSWSLVSCVCCKNFSHWTRYRIHVSSSLTILDCRDRDLADDNCSHDCFVVAF